MAIFEHNKSNISVELAIHFHNIILRWMNERSGMFQMIKCMD